MFSTSDTSNISLANYLKCYYDFKDAELLEQQKILT